MERPWRRPFGAGRTIATWMLLGVVLAAAVAVGRDAAAQPAPQPQQQQRAQPPAARKPAAPAQAAPKAETPAAAANLEPSKATLDEIEKALAAETHFEDTLAELRRRLTPMRSELRDTAQALEDELNQVTAQLKQLGDAPEDDEPKEDAGIAAERAKLEKHQAEIDAALKQARLLIQRADDASTKVTDLRRGLFTKELLARSAGLFNRNFWSDLSDGVPSEVGRVVQLGRAWWLYASNAAGRGTVIGAVLMLAGFGLAAVLLLRWLRHRLGEEGLAAHFGRAFQALMVLIVHAATMPGAVLVTVLVLENFGLMPAWIRAIGVGLALSVATASTGRAVALALFAPGEPARRLFAWSDAEAARATSHLTWAARMLGLAAFLNLLHKTTTAPIALTVATSTLLAVVTAGLAFHFLWRTARGAAATPDTPPGPGMRSIRVLLALFIAGMLIPLVTGYIALSAFVASRLVIVLTLAGTLVVVDAFIDALFSQVLSSASERGRAVAALLGLSHRGLDLISTLLSGVIRVALLLLAILAVLGPWGVFADDVLSRIAESAFGWQVGGVTISIQTILGAIAILLIGVLAVRGAQRWLETSFLPRTALDPGLQHSISTLFGYGGLIGVLAAVLGAVGIDLQKIALIAGALSVGIGFGLQSIVQNFVSGLILLAERPIKVGDWVVVKNEEGFVRKISVRATEIETFDRASVIIPNAEFITSSVKNWTHANTLGRVTLKVRVAYDSDIEQVREILAGCARAHPLVLKAPPPGVYLLGFGEIGLDFELRCILSNVENGLTVKSDLHVAVLKAFREAGIKIPYPPHEERVPGPPLLAHEAALTEVPPR
jgi:small-conductance mechanosensitive channel